MPDIFTENSSQSIFGRLGDSIKGVLFGIILIPIAIVLLFWNEGRAVKTAASLKEGTSAVVSVSADEVQAANEGKLIHLSGEAVTDDSVADPLFGLSQKAIRLTRTVEMYQWKEEKKTQSQKKLGGGTENQTSWSYTKVWSNDLIKSSEFNHPEEHQNPASMITESLVTVSGHVTLGKFDLPPGIISKMSGDQPLTITSAEADLEKLPAEWKTKMKCEGGAYYIGANPATPAVGDQRVKFTLLKPGTFSILARQVGQTLGAYPTKAGREIERVESGNIPANVMFQHAKSENTLFTWGLRLVGMLLMAMGMGLILNPIATLADVLPFFGNLVGMGTSFAALLMSTITSIVVIAIAWFAVRPVLSVVLVAVAIGVFIAGKRITKKAVS